MPTIKSIIEKGSEILKSEDIESHRIDSRILLGKVLNISLEQIILKYDHNIDSKLTNEFMRLIARRAKREPIAYIIGKKEFYGMEFIVNKNVLIPRPDSEILVDTVLKIFDKNSEIKILEFGVGSGCLLITILKHMKNSSGVAVDIQEGAIEVATKNHKSLGIENDIDFVLKDWNEFESDEKFDLIISNPPYITTQEMLELQDDVKKYEPKVALEAGKDGLDAYRSLAPVIRKFLKQNGIVALEFGESQSEGVQKIMLESGFVVISISKDLSARFRVGVFSLKAK